MITSYFIFLNLHAIKSLPAKLRGGGAGAADSRKCFDEYSRTTVSQIVSYKILLQFFGVPISYLQTSRELKKSAQKKPSRPEGPKWRKTKKSEQTDIPSGGLPGVWPSAARRFGSAFWSSSSPTNAASSRNTTLSLLNSLHSIVWSGGIFKSLRKSRRPFISYVTLSCREWPLPGVPGRIESRGCTGI